MGIEIKLFATLTQFLPENGDNYPIEDGETVGSLIEKIGVPVDDVSLMFVNSLKVGLDRELQDKDRVGLFPPVGGG